MYPVSFRFDHLQLLRTSIYNETIVEDYFFGENSVRMKAHFLNVTFVNIYGRQYRFPDYTLHSWHDFLTEFSIRTMLIKREMYSC